MLAVSALGLLGCSDKLADESGNGLGGNESYVYMNVAVALPSPSATRSGTDNPTGEGDDLTNSDENENSTPDYEYGYEFENEVKNLLLVIATDKNEYITHTLIDVDNTDTGDGAKNNFTTNAKKFSRSDIVDAYGTFFQMDENNKYTARVYAFCNPTTYMEDQFDGLTRGDTDWVNWTNEEDPEKVSEIWGNNDGTAEKKTVGFLMSNAKVKEVEFPSVDGWSAYTTEARPFNLSTVTNPVYVERTAARFDFKDGSKDNDGNPNDNTYFITIGSGADAKQVMEVKLHEMSLVNMSKNYHYLRRVSADGTDSNWSVCGAETPNNYVVDTDWSAKRNGDITAANEAAYFHYPLFTTTKGYNTEQWDTWKIADVLSGKSDLWGEKSYHIWRYVTENTIPEAKNAEDSYSLQKTVQSVGIVFKGQITSGPDAENNLSESVIAALDGTAEKKPALYLYNSILYAGLDELVKKAIEDEEQSALYRSLEKVFKHWVKDGLQYKYQKEVDEDAITLTVEEYENAKSGGSNIVLDLTEDSEDFKAEITSQKIITIYSPAEDGNYYCYYFYWNRHNDNTNNSVMHRMEFATVRNNVYKLSVDKISRLGHPTSPTDDPNPVDPNDPDEEDEVYMDVTVEVLPWVVRLNSIVF